MVMTFRYSLVFLLLVCCVPLNQQNVYVPTGKELPVVHDEKLYNELRYVIENGVYEVDNSNQTKWEGPCVENPIFKQRFQSGYSFNPSEAKISNDVLTFKISYGGGCGCAEKIMVWNGKLVEDSAGRKIAELVFSFKNSDMCRAIKHDTLLYDLKTLDFGEEEDVYIRINKSPNLLRYKPSKK